MFYESVDNLDKAVCETISSILSINNGFFLIPEVSSTLNVV